MMCLLENKNKVPAHKIKNADIHSRGKYTYFAAARALLLHFMYLIFTLLV